MVRQDILTPHIRRIYQNKSALYLNNPNNQKKYSEIFCNWFAVCITLPKQLKENDERKKCGRKVA